MKLQNYKIRTKGRNAEILDKMIEIGYGQGSKAAFMNAEYIILSKRGLWGWGSESSFPNHCFPEISVDDFLKLGNEEYNNPGLTKINYCVNCEEEVKFIKGKCEKCKGKHDDVVPSSYIDDYKYDYGK